MWLEMRCNSVRNVSRREECKVGTISPSLWHPSPTHTSRLFYRPRAVNEYAEGVEEVLWSRNEIGLGPRAHCLGWQREEIGLTATGHTRLGIIRSNCVVSWISFLNLWSMGTNFRTGLYILVDNKVWERRRSQERLNFVRWRLKFVGSVPGNCVLLHSWRPECWGGS